MAIAWLGQACGHCVDGWKTLREFKAVKVSRLQPRETAVVYGVGGLGHQCSLR